jgi:hypothetical protein
MVVVTAMATGTRMSMSAGAAISGSMVFLLLGGGLAFVVELVLQVVDALAVMHAFGCQSSDDEGNEDWQHGVSPVLLTN